MNELKIRLKDESATVEMGNRLAAAIPEGIVVFMHGDLGAGKTTLSRGIIQGLGHTGRVKSPTYTIVEPYDLPNLSAYHFDLYRLADPEELEFMGFRDYFNDRAVCLIEWPEKGQDFLPQADIELYLTYADEEREIRICSKTALGLTTINNLKQ